MDEACGYAAGVDELRSSTPAWITRDAFSTSLQYSTTAMKILRTQLLDVGRVSLSRRLAVGPHGRLLVSKRVKLTVINIDKFIHASDSVSAVAMELTF